MTTALSHPTERPVARAVEAVPSREQQLERELARYKTWVAKVSAACEQVARGDLEVRILGCEDDGDIGKLVGGINRLLDITDAFVREAKATLDSASHGRFFRRVLLRGLPGTFRSAAILINAATQKMEGQAIELERARKERIEVADHFEQTIDGVVAIVASSATELQATASTLVGMSTATTNQSAEVAGAAGEMSACVQALASATEELNATATEIRRQVDGSTALARSAVSEIESTQTVMSDLARASREIGQVVRLISEIAKQTNLLALNATIEAARVGEAGKGFAVVASEVKSLARQTSGATDNIASMVASIQAATQKGVDAVTRIGRSIHEFDEMTATIAASVTEQRKANEEIGRNVQSAADGTLEVSRNISLVASAAHETADAANAVHVTATDVSKQAESLHTATRKLLAAIRGS